MAIKCGKKLNVKNKKMNQQCDKVSKLEFVAIQFGVKFTVILRISRYSLPALPTSFYLFQNFVISYNYFIILQFF